MILVFIGINLKNPFLFLAFTLEALLHRIIHKTLGLVQDFSRSLKESESFFELLKYHTKLPLRDFSLSPNTISPRISIKGDHIYIGAPSISESL